MPDTRDTNPDEVFAAIAVAAGFVSEAQRDECLQICNDFRKKGLAPRSFAKIAYEKRYLTRAQIKHIQREMRARGIHTRLGGYELLERIGSGAMGKVYQARQLSLDRIVALKVLHRDLGRDKRFVARLRREAKLAARISHPNVVQVFDVGRDQGRHFLVMEFVEGVSLKDLLEQGPLDERRAIEIVRDVARGLSEAHAHDIIHRDIKPGNIMLRFDGVPKLSDLGIALDAGSTTVGTVTGQGAVIGTPQYMSPEQCSGAEDIDYRTDIYSLGVTFFRMVCGHDPFEGPAPLVVMQKHMAEPLPDPRSIKLEISPATAALIMDMTCKDREERIQTCQEVVERCDAILAGQTEAVPRPRRRGARVITGVRAARARVMRTVRMAGLVVVLLLGAGVAWYMTRPPAYENWMQRARQAEQNKDWDTALQCYQEARTRAGKKAQIDGDIERVKQRMELSRLQQQYGENEANGDRYRNEKRWDLAESAYEQARAIAEKLEKMGARPSSSDSLLEKLNQVLEAQRRQDEQKQLLDTYWEYVEGGSQYAKEEQWAEAKKVYERAKAIAEKLDERPPGFAMLLDKLHECEAKLVAPTVPEVKPDEIPPVEPGLPPGLVRKWKAHEGDVNSLVFSPPEGQVLVSAGQDGRVKFWDPKTGKETGRLLDPSPVSALAFSPKGDMLAAASFVGKKVMLWSTASRLELRTLKDAQSVTSVAFSPKGIICAVGAAGTGEVKLWYVESGSAMGISIGTRGVSSLAFSPDGNLLLCAVGNSLKLWGFKTGGQTTDLDGHTKEVRCVAFSSRFPTAASAGDDGTVKLWDVDKAAVAATLTGHKGAVLAIAFNQSGRLLASGGEDHTVRLWDVASARGLRVIEDLGSPIKTLAFHPGTNVLAVGLQDGELSLWNADELVKP